MTPIHYLVVASRNSETDDSIRFSVEILSEATRAPLINFITFKRAPVEAFSADGSPGSLTSFVLHEPDADACVLKNLFREGQIGTELDQLLTEKLSSLHKETLGTITATDELLEQLCAKLEFHSLANGTRIQYQTFAQICIKREDFLNENPLDAKYFQERVAWDLRTYSGAKHLTWAKNDESLRDCGLILLSPIEIEEKIFDELLTQEPNKTLRKLLKNHTNFSSSNIELILSKRPSHNNQLAALAFIKTIDDSSFSRRCRMNEGFRSYLKEVKATAVQTVLNSSSSEHFTAALELLDCTSDFTSPKSNLAEAVFERLRLEENIVIQAAAIEWLALEIGSYSSKRDALEYAIQLLRRPRAQRPNISDFHAICLFLQHVNLSTLQALNNNVSLDSFENSSEYIDFVHHLDRLKDDRESILLKKISSVIYRGEHNKALFMMNSCLRHLIYGPAAADLAELYIRCLIAKGAVDLDPFDALLKRITVLDLLIDQQLSSGRHHEALHSLERMRSIEPLAEITKQAAQRIQRRQLIESLGNSQITSEELQKLNGIEFEMLLKEKFIQQGFQAIDTPVTGDYGADLVIDDKAGTRYIVQCKRFTSKVNLKAVQEVVGALRHYSGDYGIVITNSQFLPSAIKLAESNGIELWDGDKLLRFLSGDVEFSVVREAEI